MSWVRARIEELATKVGSGATPRGGEAVYQQKGIPFIRSMNVVFFGFKRDNLAYLNQEQAAALQSAEVKSGDVLLNITGASIGRVTIAPPDMEGARVNQHVCIIRPNEFVGARFLRAFLSSPRVQAAITSENYGVTRQALTKQQVLDLEVPVPPLGEQRRIADKLDTVIAQVDACRERLERVPAILKRFRQAILFAATSGGLTSDWREKFGHKAGWREVRLVDIADIQGGITKDTKKQGTSDEELPYLRVANVQRGYLDLEEIKTIRIPADRLPLLLLERGDILFNEGGDIDKLGRGWVWEGQIERCSFQNHVFRARLREKSNQPKYISWWGNSRALDYFLRSGKQTTNLASINKTVLSNLPISLPPAEEQAEIVRRVELLFSYADRLEARYAIARAQVDRLTPALLSKAFRGELVPQNPNDEPASALLERVRTQKREPAKPQKPRKATITKREVQATMTRLVDLLAEAADWIPAEEAFRLCGVSDGSSTDQVELLYAELRALDKAGQLQVSSVFDDQGRKLYDRLKSKR